MPKGIPKTETFKKLFRNIDATVGDEIALKDGRKLRISTIKSVQFIGPHEVEITGRGHIIT